MSAPLPVPQPSEPPWERFTADPRKQRNAPVRVGHADRDLIANLLADAYAFGRLDNDEYNDRLDKAMELKTVGEIMALVGDLATTGGKNAQKDSGRGGKVAAGILHRSAFSVVALNVVIWALVSASAGQAVYFWPMWVAVGMLVPVIVGYAIRGSSD